MNSEILEAKRMTLYFFANKTFKTGYTPPLVVFSGDEVS